MDALGNPIVNPPLDLTESEVQSAGALSKELSETAEEAQEEEEEQGWSDFRVGFPDDDDGNDEEGFIFLNLCQLCNYSHEKTRRYLCSTRRNQG